jgi:phage baseplate assembly protein W
MRDLAISGGDLTLSASSGFATVSGSNYIRQRIATALAEPFGSDPYESGWGSYLEGWLGGPVTGATAGLVAAEASRVLSVLIAAQAQMISGWSLTGGRAQLAAADTIASVSSVGAQQGSLLLSQDPTSILVTMALTTQAGEQIQVARTVVSQPGGS